MKQIILVLLCVAHLCFVTHSRSDPISSLQSSNPEGPTNCATNSAILDVIAQKTSADDLIIVIAHLGNRESRGDLNHRRLHNVYAYLTKYTSIEGGRRKEESVILAEGERVKGYARMELYVHGKLTEVLRARTNDDLIVGTCYPDPLERNPCTLKSDQIFYPCLDRNSRKNR